MVTVSRAAWAAVMLVLLAGGVWAGEEAVVIEGEAWAKGELAGVRYSPEAGGLVLAEPPWSPAWAMELPETVGADFVRAEGITYLVGSRKAEKGRRMWLSALSSRGRMLWETAVREFWEADSHATAVAVGPAGHLFLTGWYGSAFALAAFAADGRELWALSRAGGETLLGTDVAVVGDSVLAAALRWEDGRPQGVLLCYGNDGSFRWELPLPGAEEVVALVADEEGAWVLWRGEEGWVVSRVGPDGHTEGDRSCPEGVHPLDLVPGEDGPFLLGTINGRVVVFSPGGEPLRALPLRDLEGTVRCAALGPGGDVAAVGWRGDQGWLALWRPGCEAAWEATISGHAVRPLAVIPTGEGGWLVLSTDRADDAVTTRLSLWPTPPERRGEYRSPAFPCRDGDGRLTLRVEAAGLSRGTAVRVVLETYPNAKTSRPSVHEFEVGSERFEVPVEVGSCARFRMIVRMAATCRGSPVVHRLEVVPGQGAAEPPASRPAVAEGPSQETSLGGREVGQAPAETPPGTGEGPTTAVPKSPAEAAVGIIASTGVGLAGETEFVFRITEGEGGSWAWDLGDGTVAMGESVRHVYAGPGSYIVSVRGPAGREGHTRVRVYCVHDVRSTLPMYLPGALPVSGDFDGDGHHDLAVWSDKGRSLFLYRGRGDGTFGYLANRPLPVEVTWVTAMDMDGDGRDDLLAGEAGDPVVLWFRGSPSGLLDFPEFFTVEVSDTVPARIYPASEEELILVGLDRRGRRALARVRVEGGRLRSGPAIVLPEAPHGVRLTLGGIGGRLIEGRDTYWVDRTDSGVVAQVRAGTVLALGDLDGDGLADAIVQVENGIVACLSSGEAFPLGPAVPGDIWLVGDLAGLGVDQAIRIGRAGSVTLSFLEPVRGTCVIRLPFGPQAALISSAGAPAGLILISPLGKAVWLSLVSD